MRAVWKDRLFQHNRPRAVVLLFSSLFQSGEPCNVLSVKFRPDDHRRADYYELVARQRFCSYQWQRVGLTLHSPTNSGDSSLMFWSNLPESVTAHQIAEFYRRRWSIEGMSSDWKRFWKVTSKPLAARRLPSRVHYCGIGIQGPGLTQTKRRANPMAAKAEPSAAFTEKTDMYTDTHQAATGTSRRSTSGKTSAAGIQAATDGISLRKL